LRAAILPHGVTPAAAARNLPAMLPDDTDEALAATAAAIAREPASPSAHFARGELLRRLGLPRDALEAHRRALALRPGWAAAWRAIGQCLADRGDAALARAAFGRARALRPAPGFPGRPDAPRDGRAPRLGYLGGDFHDGPRAPFLLALLRGHAARGDEVRVYARQRVRDAMTEAMMAAAPRWDFVDGEDGEALARRIREGDLDWLVDLDDPLPGGILERCPFAWAGPGEAPLPAVPDARAPVFGRFGGLALLDDAVLPAWGAILRAVPEGRIVLGDAALNDARVRERLARRLASHGADPARLELRGPVPWTDLLADHAGIDVVLDPFPRGDAHAACAALWMGVPVVTMAGVAPASRQVAAILAAAGLADLVARTPREYAALAAALARDAARRGALRLSLRARLRDGPLGDGRELAAAVGRACRKRAAQAVRGTAA
jgi:protein O-GlcNAc transferase